MLNKKSHNSYVGKKHLLTVCGSSFAAIGLLMLLISLTTDHWIMIYERISLINVTNIISQNSGLWRKCWHKHEVLGITKMTAWTDSMKIPSNGITKNCSFISYFKGKPKNSGEMKAPEAILYEMRTSAIFSVISLIVLVIGSVLSMLSYCIDKLNKSIFVAIGLYVLSGICLLIGIVLYVGCISQAFDSKSDNSDSENIYLYEYGMSFYLSVVAFVLSEFAGVFYIYLYIAKQKHLSKFSHTSELFVKTNIDGQNSKRQRYNNIGFHGPNCNQSEISPVSNMSQMSYQGYRRCSEQLLLKLYPNTENISQYSFPSRTNLTLNRISNDNKLNKESISFIPEFRARKPSPIINYLSKRDSKENIYDQSQMVVFYNDPMQENNSLKDKELTSSLILNQATYFDSPKSELIKDTSKAICPSICNTCNLSFNLCNCACALLFLDKSNFKDPKIYSNINNTFSLPSTIYNNIHHYNDHATNSILQGNIDSSNNNYDNNEPDFESLIQINDHPTLTKVGKQRKITAV